MSSNDTNNQWGGSARTTRFQSWQIGQLMRTPLDCTTTLWFNVSISSIVVTCKRYFAKSSSSRSAIALGVWASLNADIFSPCLGFRAKLRPWKNHEAGILWEGKSAAHKVINVNGVLCTANWDYLINAASVAKRENDVQLREMIPDDLQRLNMVTVWFAIPLGKYSEHRSLVQNCEYWYSKWPILTPCQSLPKDIWEKKTLLERRIKDARVITW